MSEVPPILWTPSAARVEQANMTAFMRAHGHEDYESLRRWSVEDLDGFWAAIWEDFGVDGSYDAVLGSREMPGARWCTGARVSYPEHLFRGKDDDRVAIRHASECRETGAWTWSELRGQTAQIRAGLVAHGVAEGDRVCAYLPNIPETVAAFLATASLGAIWSSAAPEFGARSVIDRFAQTEPKVLLAIDGYRYGGRDFDCSDKVAAIAAELPTARIVRLGYLDDSGWEDGFETDAPPALDSAELPFAHPLWVL